MVVINTLWPQVKILHQARENILMHDHRILNLQDSLGGNSKTVMIGKSHSCVLGKYSVSLSI